MAVVTGAVRGIGAATAHQLATEGWRIVAVDSLGRLDAAASMMTGGQPLWETTRDPWAPMFDIGAHGTADLARAAVPAMLRQPAPRTGRFIGVASAAAHHGLWHLSGYSAAEHAAVGLIKALAHDLRGTGNTATAASPGFNPHRVAQRNGTPLRPRRRGRGRGAPAGGPDPGSRRGRRRPHLAVLTEIRRDHRQRRPRRRRFPGVRATRAMPPRALGISPRCR